MYESFYGLSAKPFSLLPDADFLFPSTRHKRVLNLLDYGITNEACFIVVTGDVGAGKTTVVRHFLRRAGPELAVGVITNPSPSLGRLLDWVTQAFGIKVAQGADNATLYNAFVDFLVTQYSSGKRAALVIDEAQNLPAEMLEELRMLSNVNNERDLILQIVLLGQPELLETLKRPELRQFVQRIAVHSHLSPLAPAETAAYIRYRLGVVGGEAAIFDDVACAAVHHFTGGVPRLVNLLCDQTLVYGFSADMKRIPLELVAEVVRDRNEFGLSAFQNVPERISVPQLWYELQPVLEEIRREAPLERQRA